MFKEIGLRANPADFLPFVGMGEDRYIGGVAEKYNVPISNYLYSPMDDEKVPFSHDVQEIMNKFKQTNTYNMVVLDGNKYIGLVSRANVLNAYRESMISEIDEY